MHEKIREIPVNGSSDPSSGSDKKLHHNHLPQRKYFFPAAHGALTLIALGSRLIICPGDDILAVAASAIMGVRTSDTIREAILPEPTEINFGEENKNRNKNKV